MRLFSATTAELREALETRPEFKVGHLSSRLSPLERYPVVRLETASGDTSLIVPNIRQLAKSFGPILDYSLQDRFGNRYNDCRGPLHELYVRRLVEERLPELVVIPETSYDRDQKRGPDLTIVDHRHQRLILVEIKARRMTLSTRLTMEPASFNENLRGAYEALLKLPEKVQELYSGRREYQQYQAAIEATRGMEPIFVVVLSEGVYSMSHIIRLQAMEKHDPLHGYPYTYCVLAMDSFELAVEIARLHGRPLHELLEEHWKKSGASDNFDSADWFGGIVVPEEEMFAAQFAPPVLAARGYR